MSPHKPIEEYRELNLQTIEWVVAEVRKNHDDILVIKTKMGGVASIFGFIFGVIGGVCVSVVTQLILHAK